MARYFALTAASYEAARDLAGRAVTAREIAESLAAEAFRSGKAYVDFRPVRKDLSAWLGDEDSAGMLTRDGYLHWARLPMRSNQVWAAIEDLL